MKSILFGVGFGLFMGVLMVFLLGTSQANSFVFLIEMALLFVSFIIGFILHIMFHELGHLIAGLASGYEFISFRVGSLTLIKEDNKLKFKKFSIQGTAGQCLMMPPDVKPDVCPYLLYNLGGIFMNLLLALLSLFIVFIFPLPRLLNAFLVLFMVSGILSALMNGLPLKMASSQNDGRNVLEISRDLNQRYAFYYQLKIIGLLYQGIRLKEIPLHWFELPKPISDDGSVLIGLKGIEASCYQDRHDFDKAKEIYEDLLSLPNLIEIYKLEAQCELLFYKLLGEGQIPQIEPRLTQYIKAMKTHVSKQRLLIAMALLMDGDEEKANQLTWQFEKLATKYPAQSEVEGERELIQLVKVRWEMKKQQIQAELSD